MVSVILCILPFSIWAQPLSMKTGDGGAMYFEKDSILKNGNVVTARYIKDLGGNCTSYKESKRGARIPYCSQIWTTEFDCQKKLFKYKSSLTMSAAMGKGTVQSEDIFESGSNRYGAEFTDVTKFKPDESTNVAFQLACQLASLKK